MLITIQCATYLIVSIDYVDSVSILPLTTATKLHTYSTWFSLVQLNKGSFPPWCGVIVIQV